MKQEILNLIDKVVGKKGIMRSPAWFVNKLFKKTLDYADKVADDAAAKVKDTKEDKIPIIYPVGIYETLTPDMEEANEAFYEAAKIGKVTACKIVRSVGAHGSTYYEDYFLHSSNVGVERRYVSGSYVYVVTAYFIDGANDELGYALFLGAPVPAYSSTKLSNREIFVRKHNSEPALSDSQKAANRAFYEAALAGEVTSCVMRNTSNDGVEFFQTININQNRVDCYSSGIAFDLLHLQCVYTGVQFTEDNCESPSYSRNLFHDGEDIILVTQDKLKTVNGNSLYGTGDITINEGTSINVINNLESNSTTAALSANQGRVLSERIGDIDSILDSINGEEI